MGQDYDMPENFSRNSTYEIDLSEHTSRSSKNDRNDNIYVCNTLNEINHRNIVDYSQNIARANNFNCLLNSIRRQDSSSSLCLSVGSHISQLTKPETDDSITCESSINTLTGFEKGCLEYISEAQTICVPNDDFERELDSLSLSLAMNQQHPTNMIENLNSLDLNHVMGIARQRTEKSNKFLQEIVEKTINLVELRRATTDDSSCASAPSYASAPARCQQVQSLKGEEAFHISKPFPKESTGHVGDYGSSTLNTKKTISLNRVHTMPSLHKPQIIFGRATASVCSNDNSVETTSDSKDPHSHLISLIQSQGLLPDQIDKVYSLSMTNYFLEPTAETIAAYDNVVTGAVRSENLTALKDLHAKGKQLQCCNRFGESILHIACRRGSLSMVRFLLDEAHVSLRIRDDFGRTPLHDACWTRDPAFELMRFIIEREPDLLFISDKRGHTPLQYLRRDDWKSSCKFLSEFESKDLIPSQKLINLLKGTSVIDKR